MHPPETLRSGRLLLRRSRLEDAAAIYEGYAADPEVTRYLIWRPHAGVAETEAFLALSREQWEAGRVFAWQLWQGEAVIGAIALRPESPTRATVGFVLARARWGRGFAPEAIRAVTEWTFANTGTRRLWAVCDVDNAASARAMEKAGFAREGVLRRWIVHPNLGDEPRDCLCYARTR